MKLRFNQGWGQWQAGDEIEGGSGFAEWCQANGLVDVVVDEPAQEVKVTAIAPIPYEIDKEGNWTDVFISDDETKDDVLGVTEADGI